MENATLALVEFRTIGDYLALWSIKASLPWRESAASLGLVSLAELLTVHLTPDNLQKVVCLSLWFISFIGLQQCFVTSLGCAAGHLSSVF